jgi:hypothetical protein
MSLFQVWVLQFLRMVRIVVPLHSILSASWTLCRMGDLMTKDTREGWPQPTVETEVTGDSKSTIKGVLPTSFRSPSPPLPLREGRQVEIN